jgi:hypothetical protein
MDALVKQLSTGIHPVAASRYKSSAELEKCIERGFVLVNFTGTRGGTELGFHLDAQRTQTTNANFGGGEGSVHLEGELSLNYEKVRCIADIDLKSLSGEGRLETLCPK